MQVNYSIALLLYKIVFVGCASYTLNLLERGEKSPLCFGSISDIS